MILLEADLRRPTIGEPSATPKHGVVSVLIENVPSKEAPDQRDLRPAPALLLADYSGGWIADLFSLPAANPSSTTCGRSPTS